MNLPRSFRIALLAVACIGMAPSAASAIELRQQSGVAPLRPSGPSVPSIGRKNVTRPGISVDRSSPGVTAPGATPSINHIQWCQNRYNSYNRNNNTYQPFAGTRRDCSSPFGE